MPANPGAWITRVARNKAIDRLRRRQTLARKTEILEGLERLRMDEEQEKLNPAERPPGTPGAEPSAGTPGAEGEDVAGVVSAEELAGDVPFADDRLRLIFTCCHPALAPEARVALTLKMLGGLSTAEIAAAFLTSEPTMAQRIVRAKRKIAAANIPYRVPGRGELDERLGGVLATLYLVFNEGYFASGGERLVRTELCADAIRLARLVHTMLPAEPEVAGLLALMLIQDSRSDARVGEAGELVLLGDQDRSLWNRAEIEEALGLLAATIAGGEVGRYGLQAAIAAEHARAPSAEATDWARIRELYDLLRTIDPGPVVELNRAVAVGMESGPQAGLDALSAIDGLGGFHLLHSTRAELLSRLGRAGEAADAYGRAIELAANPVQRAFLERRRLSELGDEGASP